MWTVDSESDNGSSPESEASDAVSQPKEVGYNHTLSILKSSPIKLNNHIKRNAPGVEECAKTWTRTKNTNMSNKGGGMKPENIWRAVMGH